VGVYWRDLNLRKKAHWILQHNERHEGFYNSNMVALTVALVIQSEEAHLRDIQASVITCKAEYIKAETRLRLPGVEYYRNPQMECGQSSSLGRGFLEIRLSKSCMEASTQAQVIENNTVPLSPRLSVTEVPLKLDFDYSYDLCGASGVDSGSHCNKEHTKFILNSETTRVSIYR